jgi:hypothetical protein
MRNPKKNLSKPKPKPGKAKVCLLPACESASPVYTYKLCDTLMQAKTASDTAAAMETDGAPSTSAPTVKLRTLDST